MTTLPDDIDRQIDEQLARLDALATERRADDPAAPGVNLSDWRRRQADRAIMEGAAVARIEELRRGAARDAATANPRPAPANRCSSCGCKLLNGHGAERSDGFSCDRCAFLTATERAAYRAVRAVPVEMLAQYLDGLSEPELSDVFHLVNAGPRDARALREAAAAATRRRQRRQIPAHGAFHRQRRLLADKVRHGANASDSTVDAWTAINASLNPALGPAGHLAEPATRQILDGLGAPALTNLQRLAATVRDHDIQALVVAEQRRRRTASPGGHGVDSGAA